MFSLGESTVAAPAPCVLVSDIAAPEKIFTRFSDTPSQTTCLYLFKFGFAHGMTDPGPFVQIALIHVLAFECCRDSSVHHHFGKMHRSLVESIDSFADCLIII